MSGLLGKAGLAEGAITNLYTVPSGKTATVNLNLCNRHTTICNVRVAIASGDTPDNADYLEYDALIPAKGIIERTGLVMSEGETLFVWASNTGISARAYGFEENE